MLAPLSWLVLIIMASFVLIGIPKSSEFVSVTGAWFVLERELGMSKSIRFAGVASAVVFGFDYRSLHYINGYF